MPGPAISRSTSFCDGRAHRDQADQQGVAEEELVAVAKARVDNVSAALIEANAALEGRIRTGQLQATEAEEDGSVRMDITLTGGS